MKAISLFLSLFIAYFATGCTSIYFATYSASLVQIDRPETAKVRYGKVVTITSDSTDRYSYEDGLISGIFYLAGSFIHFTMYNKTEHSIKISWDEAAFIDLGGQSGRVMHTGIPYADRNKSQPPSIIASRSTLTDLVFPTDNVYKDSRWRTLNIIQPATKREYWRWERRRESKDNRGKSLTERFISKAESNKGKRFGLLLPLEIQGTVNEYTFWFEVQDVSFKKEAFF